MPGRQSYTVYKLLFWGTQLVGLSALLLICIWVFGYRGGLAWHSQPRQQFNWHVLLMPLAMVYLCANELMTFRALRYFKKKHIKWIHAGFSLVIIFLVVIGYWAVYECLNYQGKPSWFSLHSWLGVVTTILYLTQALVGCSTFLWPGTSITLRKIYKPIHTFIGLTTFVMASVTNLLGMYEQMKNIVGYKEFSSEGIITNMCGLLFTLFTILVILMQTFQPFERQPLATD